MMSWPANTPLKAKTKMETSVDIRVTMSSLYAGCLQSLAADSTIVACWSVLLKTNY